MHIYDAVNMLKSLRIREKKTSGNNFIKFSTWVESIAKTLPKEKFTLRLTSHYNAVAQMELIFPPGEKWNPVFQPQITIQHPLESTIPLYFSLFGFDDDKIMRDFMASLPFYNILVHLFNNFESFKKIAEHKNTVYNLLTRKLAGLTFLHALTLVHMIPEEDKTDKDLLEDILKRFEESHQIDPKSTIILMSRRPFSSMLNDIHQDPHLTKEGGYTKFFEKYLQGSVEGNELFTESYQVPNVLFRTNYGEQFFNETGQPVDLSHLGQFFNEDFFNSNSEIINQLLRQGIISTPMIRNFKPGILPPLFNTPNLYYKNILESIDIPSGTSESPRFRYKLNIDPRSNPFEAAVMNYDMLSPPPFLHDDNSMGRYKEEKEIDKRFGEAIIEVRGIKEVKKWFLGKIRLSKPVKPGAFLKSPRDVLEHGKALFNYLQKFGSNEEDINDIKLGLCYRLIQQ